MIDEIMDAADEEIERTAQEAVKAVLVEMGGELAYEREKRIQYEAVANDLRTENAALRNKISSLERRLSFWKPFGIATGIAGACLGGGLIYATVNLR